MRIVFGSDHAGFSLRETLEAWALEQGHEVSSFGATSEEAYDYPDASDAVACELLRNHEGVGVLVCGTGIGVSIRANRYEHIRAANCCSTKMAELARLHNHANVLCLGSRTTEPSEAVSILSTFLSTGEDLAERHSRRVLKLDSARPSC